LKVDIVVAGRYAALDSKPNDEVSKAPRQTALAFRRTLGAHSMNKLQ